MTMKRPALGKINDFFKLCHWEKINILRFHSILAELLTLFLLPKLWQGLIRDSKL